LISVDSRILWRFYDESPQAVAGQGGDDKRRYFAFAISLTLRFRRGLVAYLVLQIHLSYDTVLKQSRPMSSWSGILKCFWTTEGMENSTGV
jgi:hypothetical protein